MCVVSVSSVLGVADAVFHRGIRGVDADADPDPDPDPDADPRAPASTKSCLGIGYRPMQMTATETKFYKTLLTLLLFDQ